MGCIHDLLVDPNDLPPVGEVVLIKLDTGYFEVGMLTSGGLWSFSNGLRYVDNVIAWIEHSTK